jgi:membrane peptidoglycan carboxypeptidase
VRRITRLLLVLVVLLGGGWLAYTLLLRAVPPVGDLPARVHARLAAHHAPYSPLSEIPDSVQQATVQTEDERFYQHHGIDLLGLMRSVYDDVRSWCLCEGGSTLTEQLAKQIYLGGSDNSVSHKLGSMLLALKIERQYSKAQILEFYLNTAYYGHGAYGVGQAAQTYWSTQIAGVDLAQAAMLAGLPQAPSDYDPILHPAAARIRREEVLKLLTNAGAISSAAAAAANAAPVSGTARPALGTFRRAASS